jgi:flavodoxin
MARNGCMIFSTMVPVIIGCGSGQKTTDAVSGATNAVIMAQEGEYNVNSKRLVILFSMENSSTAKVANAIANVLDADVKLVQQVDLNDIEKYDLIGFGSGIFDQKHHVDLLKFADILPFGLNKNVFIFSTSGVARSSSLRSDGTPKFKNKNFTDPHIELRKKLLSKGFTIVGEFNCVGFNNNSFLKLFGGMNKGRPNESDLKLAEEFAMNIIN